MRGVVRTGRERVEVVELPQPQAEPGTAVVKVLASGICGSDLHLYRNSDSPERHPSGHEIAGEVVEVIPHANQAGTGQAGPSGRPGVQVGDRVAIDTICLGRACGECRWCQEGAPFHCEHKRGRETWTGAFAEYIKRDVRGLFPIPPQMSDEDGALVEPLAVAVHALRLAQLHPGDSVAIVGAGTIGLNCLIAAVAMGAGPVYVLARYPHQAELARALGAAEVFTDGPEEAEARVKERTGGTGVDLVLETVGGSARTLDQALALVRRRGRVAVLGVFDHAVPVDLGRALSKEVAVSFPVCYGELDGRHDYDVTIDLIASGKAPVRRLLTHRFPLEQAQEAFTVANDKHSGSVKVQLIP